MTKGFPVLFKINNASKRFTGENDYLALDRVNLEIREGTFVCLLGASGCGKSTLLNLLAGFDTPTDGAVLFRDKPISGAGRERVMLFQDAGSALLPWLTALDNVAFGLKLQGVASDARYDRARQCLEICGLLDHWGKFPHEMSGGMRQRLQIARALAVDPDVLLMDEPFGALDAITRRRMHEALLNIWQATGKTIVFVTHDILEAISLADRIVIMNVGPGSFAKRIIDLNTVRPRDPSDPRVAPLFKEIENELYAAGVRSD